MEKEKIKEVLITPEQSQLLKVRALFSFTKMCTILIFLLFSHIHKQKHVSKKA